MYGNDPTQQVISSSYKGFQLTTPLRPFWSIDVDSEASILAWANETIPALLDYDQDRRSTIINNRNFYLGLQSFRYGGNGGVHRGFADNYRGTMSSIFANQIYDIIEQKVSKLTRYPATIEVLPTHNEHSDRQAARVSGLFVDHLFYINEMDEYLETMVRNSRTDGESFMFIEWDKDKGDLMPGTAKAFEKGKRVPLLDSKGNQIFSQTLEPLYIEKPVKTGDINYSIVNSHDVLLEPKDIFGDSNWAIKITKVHLDELKADHPGVNFDEDNEMGGGFDSPYYPIMSSNPGDVIVYELYHRYTRFLGKGRYVKLTANTVIENKDLPYSHGEIPYVRLSDIRAPGELRGISFLQNVLLLQVMYNQLFALMYRNIALGAHLYWLIPRGANVDAAAIRDSESAITYSGGVPPSIQTFRTVGGEVFNLLSIVREELQKIARIHGVSRGDIPARAESGVFLAALEEQENQSQNAEIKHQNAVIRKIARHSLAVAGDFYKKEDGRTLRIVGKDYESEVEVLDVSKLSGPYEIRTKRSTSLSESPATRLAQIQTIAQTFPGMVPEEQVMDMLDLSNEQKFYDLTTQALKAAEREVEKMNEGIEVKPPERWEVLLTHHDVHARAIQTSAFKAAPENVQQLHLEHLILTEALIYEKAFVEGNPALQQKLMTMPNFPLVFVMPPSGASAGAPPVEEGGQKEKKDMPTGSPDEQAPEPLETTNAAPVPPGETPLPPKTPAPSNAPAELA